MEMLLLVIYLTSLLVVLIAICTQVFARMSPTSERRAETLLRAILTRSEYQRLTWQGYIDIPSPSDPRRMYRVPLYPSERVQVRVDGRVTEWLCLQPASWVPDADLVIIHKLMIQANEEVYLRTANHCRNSLIHYDALHKKAQ